MTGPTTQGQARTLAARRARTRAKHERMAAELRDAGWLAVPPEAVDFLKAEAGRIEDSADDYKDTDERAKLEEQDRIREHAYGMRNALELLTRQNITP